MTQSGKSRCRTSVACSSCRQRRTKCIVDKGNTTCVQCVQNGTECMIRDTDARRRPSSKAHVKALEERIQVLEAMLPRAKSPELQATTAPQTEQIQQSVKETEATAPPSTSQVDSPYIEIASHPASPVNRLDPAILEDIRDQDNLTLKAPTIDAMTGCRPSPEVDVELFDAQRFTLGRAVYERGDCELQFFGPCANYHGHPDPDHAQGTLKAREAVGYIKSVPREVRDELMDCFWTYYNSIVPIVHKDLFVRDEGRMGPFYSPPLHLCILAIGLRYVDKRTLPFRAYGHARYGSKFHLQARSLLDSDLAMHSSIPLMQAMLLMSDLEGAVQRYHAGWIYTGIAARLCLSLGLHRTCHDLKLSSAEAQARRMALWACVTYDRCWALFVSRPTALKYSDLAQPETELERLRNGSTLSPKEDRLMEIYVQFVRLMELSSTLTNDGNLQASASKTTAYFHVTTLDSELHLWEQQLPQSVKWTQDNLSTAPLSYFLLHQQYHYILILLHRPFTYSVPLQSATGASIPRTNLAKDPIPDLSRTICYNSAIRIIQILVAYRERFGGQVAFPNGPQHITTAAITLLSYMKFAVKKEELFHRIRQLFEIAQSQSDTWFESKRTADVILNALGESLVPGVPDHRQTRQQLDEARANSTMNSSEYHTASLPGMQHDFASALKGRPSHLQGVETSADIQMKEGGVQSLAAEFQAQTQMPSFLSFTTNADPLQECWAWADDPYLMGSEDLDDVFFQRQ